MEEYNLNDKEICSILVEHLKNLNRELMETHKRVQNSLVAMDEMDNNQIEYPWYRSMN